MFDVTIKNKSLDKGLSFSLSRDLAENEKEVNQYVRFFLAVFQWSIEVCEILIKEMEVINTDGYNGYKGFNIRMC